MHLRSKEHRASRAGNSNADLPTGRSAGKGTDSDVTLQAFAGIGYCFCVWFSMVFGYRYLH